MSPHYMGDPAAPKIVPPSDRYAAPAERTPALPARREAGADVPSARDAITTGGNESADVGRRR
jgi:hypothetical protein